MGDRELSLKDLEMTIEYISDCKKLVTARTDLSTDVETLVTMDCEIRTKVSGERWFYIFPGVTGYESFELTKESVEDVCKIGWVACKGTKGSWDRLVIPAEELRQVLRQLNLIDQFRQFQVPCGLCGKPTPSIGTKRCDPCWELETRIKMDPILARKILEGLG